MIMMVSMTTTMIMVMPVVMVVMVRIMVVTDMAVAICMLMISPHRNKRRPKERILELLKNRANSQKSSKKWVRRLLQRKSKN